MGNITNNTKIKRSSVPYNIAIIGGGPAGMMAAISASATNPKSRICILEKNNSVGKKLLLTGNGRCNFTSSVSFEDLIKSFGKNGMFFYNAFREFSNSDLINFFKTRGISPSYEEDYKIFPESGRSETILNCLKAELIKANIDVWYDFEVTAVTKISSGASPHCSGGIESLSCNNEYFKIDSKIKAPVFSKKIIMSTGGMSYPQTGSCGDGYRLAKNLGHNISELSPSLVPLVSNYLSSLNLKGISLIDAGLAIISEGKTFASKNGKVIFTHYGISGPAPISLGNIVYKLKKNKKTVYGVLDLCPDFPIERILKKYEEIRINNVKKDTASTMKILFDNIPNNLLKKLFEISKIDFQQKAGNTSKADITAFLNIAKKLTFGIEGTLPLNEAIVTEGGISLKEVNPKTMQSKIMENLYFAGEIIEIQGPEGGFNLQKAFSTGWLTGKSV